MPETVFIDTNVLVYVRDRSEPDKQARVAAALRAGCRWLLTEDLQDGREILGLTVVIPLHSSSGEILGA